MGKKKKKKETSSIDTIYSNEIIKPQRMPVLTLFLMALISGLIGGFVADYTATTYNLWGQKIVEPADNTETPENPDTRSITTEQIISQDRNQTPSQIEDNVRTTQKSIIPLFIKKDGESTDLLSQSYLPNEMVGQAFVLTSDGWIMTSSYNVETLDETPLIAVTNDNTIHDVSNVIVDTQTKTAFFKIESNNLPVSKFDTSKFIGLNDNLIVFNSADSIALTHIHSPQYTPLEKKEDLIHSSEKYYTFITLDRALSKTFLGSPVVNGQGEIIGIVDEIKDTKTIVMPMTAINPIIAQIFRSETPKRPYLGINFIDLSQLIGAKSDDIKQVTSLSKGALIYEDSENEIIGVKKDSPAQLAGLKPNDVIIKIENEELTKNKTLPEILNDYPIGRTITLTILRDFIEQEIPVTITAK